MADSESLQQKHFDNLAAQYTSHYADPTGILYRNQFIYSKMFDGLPLKDSQVLDAMCGMGTTSEFLLTQGARVTALDISESFVEICKNKYPQVTAIQGSILNMPFKDNSFDYISIVGGLHHLHPHLNQGLTEIHRVLKKNGLLICMEPPAESLLDKLRQLWYRYDKYFEDNEMAIDLSRILKDHSENFSLSKVSYGLGPAYFIIFNSMITRTPLWIKKSLAPLMFLMDRIIERVTPRYLAAYMVFRIQKK